MLVSLGDQPAGLGARGELVTLRFETADVRAAGFGGCNRFRERRFFDALTGTMCYEVSDSILTLRSGRHTLSFRAARA